MLSSDHAQAREEAARHPALTDPVTGLANRLHFELVYNYLFAAADRGMTFTIMLVSSGASESASDDQVREIGLTVHETTRGSDLVSHIGGGRYVALLLATNLQGARIAADRIEMALDGLAPGPVAFGLASWGPAMTTSGALLDAAEKALLVAEAGGGGVEFA